MNLRTVAITVPLLAAGCGTLAFQTHGPGDARPRRTGVASVAADDGPLTVRSGSAAGSPRTAAKPSPPSSPGTVRVASAQDADLTPPSGGPEGTGGELRAPGEGTGGELSSPGEGTGGELPRSTNDTPSGGRAAPGSPAGSTPPPTAPDIDAASGTGGAGAAGGPSGPGIADSQDLAEDVAEKQPAGPPLELGEVLGSVYASYPLLDAAYRERTIAFGNAVSTQGEFDTKLKGATENQPLGYYENYRHRIGVEQPLFGGGDVFGQYRIGRGFYEPWYKERQTNDGGEFRAGVVVPLLRGQEIDPRRADLFRANLARNAVEPEIRAQLLDFTRAAAYAYWGWVAAGRNFRVAEALLENADRRVDALRRRSEVGDVEPIILADNERLIVSRRAKLIDAERKLREAAVKLSLFYRDEVGRPVVVTADRLPADLPRPGSVPVGDEAEIDRALASRPELQALAFQRRQLGVDLRQAYNEMLPDLDAGIVGSQDVGAPASKTRDKSEFELEAGMTLDVPLQRRKARGKITATEGKLAQLNAKTRFTRDKVAAEVRAAAVALSAAAREYEQAARSLELARTLEDAERRKFDLGESDLFVLNAREQQTAEASLLVVEALYVYQVAMADYCAALGEPPGMAAAVADAAGSAPPPPPPLP